MSDVLVSELESLRTRLDELFRRLNIETRLKELADVENQMAQPGFWDHQEAAQVVVRKCSALRAMVKPFQEIGPNLEELEMLVPIAMEEDDSQSMADFEKQANQLKIRLEKLEQQAKLSGPDDGRNAYVNIQAGTGGTDANDWAEMLLRMYVRWAENNEYAVEVVDREDDEEAGIRHATLRITGPYSFGYLKGESGVHRLIRISPFDAQGRRQTSFAAIDVMPEVDDDFEIDISDSDLRVDTFRASGAGGQHVNKTDSAVRITHIPTGVVVACQNERSQHANRRTAMLLLQAKLRQAEELKREEELQKLYSAKGEIAWGNQIRTYWLHPDQRVKDHRTKAEVGNSDGVLDGKLAPFMEAYLKMRMEKEAAG